uniref:Phosphoinositide phospholipase C n=1 Tax=Meloidogyne javanica TaxID=6303 RepID=A0A915N9E0_MELJA
MENNQKLTAQTRRQRFALNNTKSEGGNVENNCEFLFGSSSSTLEEQIEINSRSFSTTIPPKYSTATTSTRSSSSTSSFSSLKTQTLDLRLIKDVQVLSQIGTTMQITEKWRRDSALQRFDKNTVLCISWGVTFIPNNWLILFDNKELCNLWCQGLRQLCLEQANASQALIVERWLRKQFCSLLAHPTDNACISIKHMKPFVQQRLQCKISGKQLQEIIENEMGFESFVFAHNWLLNFHSLFMSMFSDFVHPQNEQKMPFRKFVDFLKNVQNDELGKSPELASDYLRRYFRDVDPDRDIAEPWLSTSEFMDYLFSCDNSLFDPVNKEVVHDMTKPLTHYWISSSHNTYLTGDQLKSESSLDAYARSLLLGCRCVELDCWDGPQRRGPNGETIIDIVIYHGYTMTSKLALKDVLQTIKHYAFRTSDYPLILSIEDNCSVPAQRQMAIDIQEVLGDLLLTSPISRDEWELPSPSALRNKIILKHKKLREEQQENDNLNNSFLLEDELDQDILSRQCIKKGVLWLKNDVSSANNNGGMVHHCRIKTNILPGGEKRYHLLDTLKKESLYELISYYMKHSLNTPNFKTYLLTPCPQPQPHLDQQWFCLNCDTQKAEELLTKFGEDGGFLIRYSKNDTDSFVLSLRVDSINWHLRLKREGRVFVVGNQIFENLCQLVEYFGKIQFFRGICLKHPVNEETVKNK